jgi:septal ring factor EnvC (AmiA/AmiB activator)
MKLIKKYWLVITGAVVAIIGFMLFNGKSKKVNKINKKIKENEKEIEVLEEKIEVVEEARAEVAKEIVQHETLIEALEEKKENIVVEELSVEEAKDNILAKTSRGRKKKK